MKKILITGVTGFIGKNLLDYLLKKKYFIYAVLKKSKKNIKFSKEYKINKNFKSIIFSDIYDLKKQLSNYKIDYVIHAATHYVKQHKSSDIKKIIESNILFPTIIADLLCSKKIKKFINFGTVWQHYNNKKVVSIKEKPKKTKSRLAITGLYFFDKNASLLAKKLKPSKRNELEIVDLIRAYL